MPTTAAKLLLLVNADTKDAEKGLKKVNKSISGFAKVAQIGFGVFAGNLMSGAVRGLQNLAFGAVDAYASFERLEATMTSLVARELRGADATLEMADAMSQAGPRAKELLKWVEELAIKSPFSQEGVAVAFRTAQAYGFTSAEAQRMTAAMIDFASGSGASEEAMNRIALALGQIKAKGKLAGQEVLQLVNAGIDVNGILAKAFGVTTEELLEMREKGLVPAKEAIEAIVSTLEDDFGGAAEQQAGTIAGLISTFEDLREIMQREFIGPALRALQPFLEDLAEMLQSKEWKDRVNKMGEDFGNFAKDTIENITGMVKAWDEYSNYLKSAAVDTGLAIGAIALAWSKFGPVGGAIAAVTAVLYTYNKEITQTIKNGNKMVQAGWDNFFKNQVSDGKNAVQIANEYARATANVRKEYEKLSPWIKASIENHTNGAIFAAMQDQKQLAKVIYGVSDSYDEYIRAMRIAGALLLAMSEAEWMATREAQDADKAMLNLADSHDLVSEKVGEAASAQKAANTITMEAADTLDILQKSMSDAGWEAGAMEDTSNNLAVALGEVSRAEQRAKDDVKLLTDSFTAGLMTKGEYIRLTREAADGTLELTQKVRGQYQANLDLAYSQREAARAAQEMKEQYLDLSESMSSMYARANEQYASGKARLDAEQNRNMERQIKLQKKINESTDPEKTREYRQQMAELKREIGETAGEYDKLAAAMEETIEKQIAQAAISELGRLREADLISSEDYFTAVSGVQEAFGLVNDQGIAMTIGLQAMSQAMIEGRLPAEEYDRVLKDLIADAADGAVNLDELLGEFLETPAATGEAIGGLENAQAAVKETGSIAKASAAEVKGAFTDEDWREIGANVGLGIAAGINDSAPAIAEAAGNAATAAIEAAEQKLEIESPSAVFKEIGRQQMVGWGLGIDDNADLATAQTMAVAGQVQGAGNTDYSGTGPDDFQGQLAGALEGLQVGGQPVNLTINIDGQQLRDVTMEGINQELSA